MKSALLCLTLLCGDITPELDDKFESENKTSGQPAAATAEVIVPATITAAAAEKLIAVPAADTAQLIASDGQDVTVLGQVHSVYIPKSGSPVILNLGEDFKSCTKAVIYDRNFRKWKLSAKEIEALYTGQTLIVEGQVSLYKELPQIEIHSPAQLRVVK
jgi:hypothetical protein